MAPSAETYGTAVEVRLRPGDMLFAPTSVCLILYAEGVLFQSPGSAHDVVMSAALGNPADSRSALKGLHRALL
jgi:hypothetical protein